MMPNKTARLGDSFVLVVEDGREVARARFVGRFTVPDCWGDWLYVQPIDESGFLVRMTSVTSQLRDGTLVASGQVLDAPLLACAPLAVGRCVRGVDQVCDMPWLVADGRIAAYAMRLPPDFALLPTLSFPIDVATHVAQWRSLDVTAPCGEKLNWGRFRQFVSLRAISTPPGSRLTPPKYRAVVEFACGAPIPLLGPLIDSLYAANVGSNRVLAHFADPARSVFYVAVNDSVEAIISRLPAELEVQEAHVVADL